MLLSPASLFALVAIAVALGSASSHSIASFYTPEKAAYCKFHIPLGFDLNGPTALECWTPSDGFTVVMRAKGVVSKAYAEDNKPR